MILLKSLLAENVYTNKTVIAYHGTSFTFDTFATRRKVSGTGYTMGAYFSSSKSEAKRYGKNIGIYELLFSKILDFSFIQENDKNGKSKFFNYCNDTLKIEFPFQQSMVYSNPYFGYTTLERLDKKYNFIPKLKKRKFDGIAFNEGDGITYVAFHPHIINLVKE